MWLLRLIAEIYGIQIGKSHLKETTVFINPDLGYTHTTKVHTQFKHRHKLYTQRFADRTLFVLS